MVIRSKGFRSKTRQLMRKAPRKRGLPPVSHFLREFEKGATVAIVLEPASHGGMPHPRFQGLTGTVAGRQGRAYVVKVYQGNKLKTVVAGPEHLKLIAVAKKTE
jgi:large subunit ribosomal protein L21e